MRQWEAATWAAGVREEEVIRCAGRAVARQAEELTRPGQRILFLAGRGHNGDDAAWASEFLQGREKELLRVVEPSPDALAAALARSPALVVDGLFGIGLNRDLSEPWQACLARLNAAGVPVLAVDVPSGLDAQTGRARPLAVRAAVTLTLGAPKAGLVAPGAEEWVGRLETARDIGLVACPFQSELQVLAEEDFKGYPPPRSVTGHKGSFGHLAIVAGSEGYHGAAVLAAQAAQRAHPGLITLLVPERLYAPVASQLRAVMVRPYIGIPELPAHATAILAGPGLASSQLPAGLREWVLDLWREAPVPVVLDASALDWLPAAPGPSRPGAVRVVTPHPGEAARLLGWTGGAAVQADRWGALRQISLRLGGCLVVLKGHHTLLGGAAGPVLLNPTGNPWLAQGGSGDVLAGFLAGLLAQPGLAGDPERAAAFAVWRHGQAADRLVAAQGRFVVEDLLAGLGAD